MSRCKLVAVLDDRDTARSLAAMLEEILAPAPDAVTSFEEGPDRTRVEAYYAHDVDLAGVHALLAEMMAPRAVPDLVQEQVPDLNWVALSQAALPPVRAGRFIVHGSHDIARVPQGPFAILIDAGEAFGTAHHATTEGCLVAIDRLTRRRRYRSVLDLGCGTGVLAIAARRALPGTASHVLATDIDPEAVRVARANIAANGLAGRVVALAASGLRDPRIRAHAPFDLLVANILAAPLLALAKEIAGIVAPNGSVVLSGLLVEQAAQVAAAYRAAGFSLDHVDRRNGWATLEMVRRRGAGARTRRAG